MTPRIGYTVGYQEFGAETLALAAWRAGVTIVIGNAASACSPR